MVDFNEKVEHINIEIQVLSDVGTFLGIVDTHDQFTITTRQVPCIINKFIHGKTLRKGEYIRGRENMLFLRDAINHLHSLGYYNLDLLPQNIILEKSDGKPWIFDLGTAVKNPEDTGYYKQKDKDQGRQLLRDY